MNFVSTKAQAQGHTDEQWQARIDLAAAHRCAVMHDLHEGIFNHLTLRVPGHDDRYYQIPFGTHWSEVTASCFMEVGYDGIVGSGENSSKPLGQKHYRKYYEDELENNKEIFKGSPFHTAPIYRG